MVLHNLHNFYELFLWRIVIEHAQEKDMPLNGTDDMMELNLH